MTIDATGYPALIGFTGSTDLGVLYNGYRMGDNITVPEGYILELTLYNGN